jgi:hypothetical protein
VPRLTGRWEGVAPDFSDRTRDQRFARPPYNRPPDEAVYWFTDQVTHTVPVAAAKAGFSASTGYRLEPIRDCPRRGRSHSTATARPARLGLGRRSRAMLRAAPGISAIAVLEELRSRHPEISPGVRRTLERRIAWRALCGPEQDVISRRVHGPVRRTLSDLTDMADLGVLVAGLPLNHRLYHFRLAFFGFEHAEVVLREASFAALAKGLQDATLGARRRCAVAMKQLSPRKEGHGSGVSCQPRKAGLLPSFSPLPAPEVGSGRLPVLAHQSPPIIEYSLFLHIVKWKENCNVFTIGLPGPF